MCEGVWGVRVCVCACCCIRYEIRNSFGNKQYDQSFIILNSQAPLFSNFLSELFDFGILSSRMAKMIE